MLISQTMEPDVSVKNTTRLSDLSLRILALLEDGEWHDWEDVIDAVMYTIPPGEAFRYADRKSMAQNDSRTQDEKIAAGRRGKVVEIINNLVTNDRIERESESHRGSKKLRLVEDICPIYVLRQSDGTLTVEKGINENVIVHIIDAWSTGTGDPQEDLKWLKNIEDTLPNRLPGRENVLNTCRQLKNRLNVRRAFTRL